MPSVTAATLSFRTSAAPATKAASRFATLDGLPGLFRLELWELSALELGPSRDMRRPRMGGGEVHDPTDPGADLGTDLGEREVVERRADGGAEFKIS